MCTKCLFLTHVPHSGARMTAPLQHAASHGDNLPQGYKRTEVGVIPVEWEVKRLGEVIEKIVGGGTPSRSNSAFWDGNIPWVTVKDFATFNPLYTQEYITIEGVKHSATNLIPKGSLITSTRMALGKAVIYQVDVTINQDMKAIFPSNSLDILYLYFWFEKKSKYIESLGNGSTVMGLSLTDLKSIPFIAPPLPEQKAIAGVLSDVDGLIATLTALIAKKRAVKHATMQQLLTGKTRLAGFTGEWEVKRLGDVFHITAGGDFDPTTSSDFWDETHLYPVYSNALTNKGLYSYCSYNNHNPDTITVTARGTLGHCEYRNHAYTAIGRLLVLEKLADVSCVYVAEYINKNIIFTIESTGVPQLTAPQISQYQIPLPPLPEQTAIAAILTDMDTEITTLETRLAKTKALKTGMCQELLTGKTRLL